MSLFMKLKEDSEKSGLKLNIQKISWKESLEEKWWQT